MAVGIVGAGALGTTAALALAKRGVPVDVYERAPASGGATTRAAGIVYDAFATEVDARVAETAFRRFRELSTHDGFEFVRCPYVWIAGIDDDRRASALRTHVDRMQANGRAVRLVAPGDLRDRFPHIETDDVAVGAVAESAGYCDPQSYTTTMLDRATRAGATIHVDTPVTVESNPPRIAGFSTRDHREYEAVLVAAGAQSTQLLAAAGIAIPCKPYRVQAMTATAPGYDAPMVYDVTAGFYCRPHSKGVLAGDGTEEREVDPDVYDRDADCWFRSETTDGITQRLDLDVKPEIRRAWAGLCTATPDGNPLLGRVATGVYVATGFHGHGFMRSPTLGKAIAEAIITGGDAPISAFDPGRFDGDEEFTVVQGMRLDES